MGIALTTHGMIWPQSVIIREKFSDLETELSPITPIEVEIFLDSAIEVEVIIGTIEVDVFVLEALESEIEESVIEIELDRDPC